MVTFNLNRSKERIPALLLTIYTLYSPRCRACQARTGQVRMEVLQFQGPAEARVKEVRVKTGGLLTRWTFVTIVMLAS